MPRFLSFIFSFESVQFRREDSHGAMQALVVAITLIVSAEVCARSALAPTGDYWEYWRYDAAEKYLWYRDLASSGNTPDVVFAGDSTAAHGLYPHVAIERSSKIATAFNAAWPANFTKSFQQSTVPLLKPPYAPPKVLVVSFCADHFSGGPRIERFENNITSCAYCRRSQGAFILGDHLYLARLQHVMGIRRSWLTGEGLFRKPRDGGATVIAGKRAKSLHCPGDNDSRSPSDHFVEDRFQTILDLVLLAQQRDFKLVVLLPPRKEPSELWLNMERELLKRLSKIEAEDTLKVIDASAMPRFKEEHFWDPNHLNSEGGRILTEYLAKQIEGLLPK